MNEPLAQAKVRWTPWSFVVIPVGFVFIAATALSINYLNDELFSLLAPNKDSFCGPTRISGLVLVVDNILLSIPIGLLLANLFVWLIPPVRRGLNAAESRVGRTFVRSNLELLKALLLVFLFLSPVHAFAIASKVCISGSQVSYQKHGFAEMSTYARSDMIAIQKICSRGSRGGLEVLFYVVMKDGKAVYLPITEQSLQHDFPLLTEIPVDRSQCFP